MLPPLNATPLQHAQLARWRRMRYPLFATHTISAVVSRAEETPLSQPCLPRNRVCLATVFASQPCLPHLVRHISVSLAVLSERAYDMYRAK